MVGLLNMREKGVLVYAANWAYGAHFPFTPTPTLWGGCLSHHPNYLNWVKSQLDLFTL